MTHDKRFVTIVITIIIAFVISYLLFATIMNPSDTAPWSVSYEGKLYYSIDHIDNMDTGTTIATSTDGNDTVKEVVFDSRNSVISGLIRIPALENEAQVPAVVVLPGATVNKEGEQALARALSQMGYASIVINQRNLAIIDHDRDMQIFLNGQESVQHLSVYDALVAAEVIRNETDVDPSKIAMIGISNGGRFAIIATALDPTIAGVVGISTSGYDVNSMAWNIQDASAIRFLRSIDPDTYFADISSRPVVFLHSQNDTTIPLMLAQRTYNKAYEPKELIVINGSRHGFDESMAAPLQKELATIFKN